MIFNKLRISFIIILTMISCVKTEPNIYGNIYGTISDMETNEPIQGAEVTLSPGGKTVVTGSDGRYEFNTLEAGQYTLSVTKTKYQTNTKYTTINPAVTTKADIALQTGKGSLYVDNKEVGFGLDLTQKVLTIQNKGVNTLNWSVSTDSEWISEINPSEGSINANSSSSITIKIDRSKLTNQEASESRLLIISDAGTEEILVTVNKINNQTNDLTITDGLVTYYNFDNDLHDLSDYNNHAHTVNNPEFTTDTPNSKGKALNLSGAKKQYLVIPSNPLAKTDGYTTLNEYTVSFWIKGISTGMIFSLIDSQESSSLPYFYIKDNAFNIGIKQNGTAETILFGSGVTDFQNGLWHMVTYTAKQGIQSLYIDSGLWSEKKVAYPTYQLTTKNPIHFGGDGGFPNYRTASSFIIDNIRFHNIAITPNQIEQIYNSEK